MLLKSTPTILAALERIPSSTREDLGLPTVSVGAPISHDDLIALARYYRNTAEADGERNPYTLDTLLRGTSVYVPPPPPKPEPVGSHDPIWSCVFKLTGLDPRISRTQEISPVSAG